MEQLRDLAGPVPDLAATLTTPIEEEANNENVSFLRTRIPAPNMQGAPPSGSSRASSVSRMTQEELEELNRIDLNELRRMQDGLNSVIAARRQQQQDGLARGMDTRHEVSYVDRMSRGTQARSTWTSESSDYEDDTRRSYVARMERSTRRQMALADELARIDAEISRSTHVRVVPSTDSSLRTTALLQSIERSRRLSERSRNQLQNYILNRERHGTDSSQRNRSSVTRIHRPSTDALTDAFEQQLRHGFGPSPRSDGSDIQTGTSPRTSTAPSPCVDDAIKYLERLRFCENPEESFLSAASGGLNGTELFTHDEDDFVLSTARITPPQETSWLKAGGIFTGSQRATGGPDLSIPSDTRSSSTLHNLLTNRRTHTHPELQGDWPVKVTIHSIDYSTMTLSATMEAFNVPSKTLCGHPPSNVTTYLEGEIIDFNTHTLKTENYEAGSRIDGLYWSKLEPFKEVKDKELVKCLVSKKWLNEELAGGWILMRWKGSSPLPPFRPPTQYPLTHQQPEKCFTTPPLIQSDLTISGFYYVSLRRKDGRVKGLYYDTTSVPYQHLELMPERRMFPAYAFR